MPCDADNTNKMFNTSTTTTELNLPCIHFYNPIRSVDLSNIASFFGKSSSFFFSTVGISTNAYANVAR